MTIIETREKLEQAYGNLVAVNREAKELDGQALLLDDISLAARAQQLGHFERIAIRNGLIAIMACQRVLMDGIIQSMPVERGGHARMNGGPRS